MTRPGVVDPQVKLDQWMTPAWAAQALIDRYYADLTSRDFVLEPSCGRGSFLQAVPESVPAIGVEVDPLLAREAEETTGRRILVGDFRLMDIPEQPSLILGNPPFDLKLIEDFLTRASELLPRNGRCGFLLPAYAVQTHRRLLRWNEKWSITAEILPRNLFHNLRLPLIFVQFRKDRVRTLSGFALFHECGDVHAMKPESRLLLVKGVSRRGVWRGLIEATLRRLGGTAHLRDIYMEIEPRRPTGNTWWQAKIRQELQRHFVSQGAGMWSLCIRQPAPEICGER